MTGITVKCNSVSDPKTAMSCGLTLSAAIRRVSLVEGGPSAAIPVTVIIGDRGHANRSAQRFANTVSPAITLLYNNLSNLPKDDLRNHTSQPAQHHE